MAAILFNSKTLLEAMSACGDSRNGLCGNQIEMNVQYVL